MDTKTYTQGQDGGESGRQGVRMCVGGSRHHMKNEASSQTGLRRNHTLPTQQSLGDTQGILGNAVRHATAQWPPDWLRRLGRASSQGGGRGRVGRDAGSGLAAVFLEAACESEADVGLSSD